MQRLSEIKKHPEQTGRDDKTTTMTCVRDEWRISSSQNETHKNNTRSAGRAYILTLLSPVAVDRGVLFRLYYAVDTKNHRALIRIQVKST